MPPLPTERPPLWPAALVLALGLAGLYASSWQAFRTLSWSDEVVYAVMGRNIAEGEGPISNFYDARSILAKGFPLGDVHMPGHAFLLGASFLALGSGEFAALLPSAAAYLAAGLLLFELGRRLDGVATGVTAAALLYALPPLTGYVHSAMAELPLVLLGGACCAAWCRALAGPHRLLPALMAVLLGLGTMFRESFLAFLPACLFVLWRWPPPHRARALAGFGLTFAAFALLVLLPQASARAPYPNFLSTMLEGGAAHALTSAIPAHAAWNLSRIPFPGAHSSGWTFTIQYLAGLLLPLACLRVGGPARRVAAFVLAGYLATLAGLVGVYPFRAREPAGAGPLPGVYWSGVRAFIVLSAPSVLLAALALRRLPRRWQRAGATALALGTLAFVSARANSALAEDRQVAYDFDQPFSRMVAASTAALRPRTVVADMAFLYGWEAYPVSVIWRATADPVEIAGLERVVPVDVIVADGPRRLALEQAVRAGMLRGGYEVVAEPSRGLYVLASRECLERASAPRRGGAP
jgi:4-amino-4-deoxy-L-arabinose transferase-like glycosyltransferase